MATWAVVGASSFSGAAFCRRLLQRGHTVSWLSRPVYDLNHSLPDLLVRLDEMRPDYVVNFAALNMVAESWAHWADYYRTNVIGVCGLAQGLLDKTWLRRFVQVSTPEVYGDTASSGRQPAASGQQLPTANCQRAAGGLSEGAPFRPSTPYAVSRAAADLHLAALARERGLPVAFTRTVNVYGPAQQLYRIVPKTVLSVLRGCKLQLHGGGLSSRSFIHVDDMAAAIQCVAERGEPGAAYHVSGAPELRIRDLVRRIVEAMGARFDDVVEDAAERPGKDPAYRLDDTLIRSRLGWRDEITLDDGLAQTIAWFTRAAPGLGGATLEYQHRA